MSRPTLRLFSFDPAIGGSHSTDGDELELSLRFESLDDIVSALGTLGVPVPPTEGHTVEGAPAIVQPGHAEIGGDSVFIWIEKSPRGAEITFSVAGTDGDAYAVTDADYEVASRIETHLMPWAHLKIDRSAPSRD